MNQVAQVSRAFTVPSRRWLSWTFTLAVCIAVAASACGDGGSSSSSSTPPPAGSAASTAEATDPMASATAGPAGAAPTAGAAGGANLPATSSLNDLPSYRYEMNFEGTNSILGNLQLPDLGDSSGGSFKYTFKGAWIKPDKAQLEVNLAGQSFKQTIIGDQQWITIAGVAQGPLPATDDAESLSFTDDFFDKPVLDEITRTFDCSQTENVNGIEAAKCVGDLDDYNNLDADFNYLVSEGAVKEISSFNGTVWIARNGGFVVKTDIQVAGKTNDDKDFSFTLTQSVSDIGQVDTITP